MLLIHMVNHTALHVEYMANGNNGSGTGCEGKMGTFTSMER